MLARWAFAGITAFWLTMNFLLWRAEFGGGRETVSEIPVAAVMDRALNAPDASVLTLYHHRERIGRARVSPSIVEEAARSTDAEAGPEGMVRSVAGYRLELELNLFGDNPSARWRLLGRLDLTTNQVWEAAEVRLIQRPVAWTLSARAGDDSVKLRYDEGKASSEQVFSAKDLPQMAAMMTPLAPLLGTRWIGAAGLAGQAGTIGKPGIAPAVWTARNDWLKAGRHRVRAYSLRGRLLGRFDVIAYFSRAGEILKASLPDGYSLVNDALPAMMGDPPAEAGAGSGTGAAHD